MSTSTRDFTVSSRSCARSGLMVPAPSADLMAAATSSGQPSIQGSAPARSPATSFRLPRASRQALLPAPSSLAARVRRQNSQCPDRVQRFLRGIPSLSWRTGALGFQASHRAPARLSTVLPAAVSNFRNASTVVLMPTQRWRCPLSCNFAGRAERLQMAGQRPSVEGLKSTRCSPSCPAEADTSLTRQWRSSIERKSSARLLCLLRRFPRT